MSEDMALPDESGVQQITLQAFSMPVEPSGFPDWWLEFAAVWALEDRGPLPPFDLVNDTLTYEAWLAAGNRGLIGDWARACCPDLGDVVLMAHGYRD